MAESFWSLVGRYSNKSDIDRILESNNPTLERLFDQEELQHECKTHNDKLIQFLSQRNIVEQLIRYIVEAPQSEDEKIAIKYPYVACDLLCAEIEQLYDTLFNDAELLHLLLSFFKNNSPHPIDEDDSTNITNRSSYFVRIINALLKNNTIKLLQFIAKEENATFVKSAAGHVGESGMDELLLKLMGFELEDEQESRLYTAFGGFSFAAQLKFRKNENKEEAQRQSKKFWIDSSIISFLIAELSPNAESEVHQNACSVLSKILKTVTSGAGSGNSTNVLAAQELFSEANIRILIDAMIANPQSTVFIEGISLLADIVEKSLSYRRGSVVADDIMTDDVSASSSSSGERRTANVPLPVSLVLEKLPQLVLLLRNPPTMEPIPTPWGVLSTPLGETRLKLVCFIAALLRSGMRPVDEVLARKECDAVNLCIDLFFEYVHNNILHQQIVSMIFYILENHADESVADNADSQQSLLQKLFIECRLAQRIAEAGSTVSVPRQGGLPNMGHVLLIANKVVEYSKSKPLIAELLRGAEPLWSQYVNTVLKDKNAQNATILGEPSSSGQQSGEEEHNDLFDFMNQNPVTLNSLGGDAGLSINTTNSTGGNQDFDFDDDDDDDEEEEDDEEDDDDDTPAPRSHASSAAVTASNIATHGSSDEEVIDHTEEHVEEGVESAASTLDVLPPTVAAATESDATTAAATEEATNAKADDDMSLDKDPSS